MSAIARRTNKKWSYIYQVRDPRNMKVKYVGATVDLKRRIYQLKRGQFCGKAVQAWMTKLHVIGASPVFEFVQKVPTEKRGPAEKAWIDYHINKGENLLNHDGNWRKWSNEKLS